MPGLYKALLQLDVVTSCGEIVCSDLVCSLAQQVNVVYVSEYLCMCVPG